MALFLPKSSRSEDHLCRRNENILHSMPNIFILSLYNYESPQPFFLYIFQLRMTFPTRIAVTVNLIFVVSICFLFVSTLPQQEFLLTFPSSDFIFVSGTVVCLGLYFQNPERNSGFLKCSSPFRCNIFIFICLILFFTCSQFFCQQNFVE